MNKNRFSLFIGIVASVAVRAQHLSTGTSVSSLQAQRPSMDIVAPSKPVRLKGEIALSDVAGAEPRLDWAKWTDTCGAILAAAIDQNVLYEGETATEYEIVILPFGLVTTRPTRFRFGIQTKCPPFPDGTAVKKIVVGVNIVTTSTKNNAAKFKQHMQSLPEVRSEEGGSP